MTLVGFKKASPKETALSSIQHELAPSLSLSDKRILSFSYRCMNKLQALLDRDQVASAPL
jgi:hypothetical protein